MLVTSFALAQAQELRPIDNLVEDAAPRYAPTRCAGLYQAAMEWAGPERFGEEMWKRAGGRTVTIREPVITLKRLAPLL